MTRPGSHHVLSTLLLTAGACGKDVDLGDQFGSGTDGPTAGTASGTQGSASMGDSQGSTTATSTQGETDSTTTTGDSGDPSSDTDIKFDIGKDADIPGAGCDPDDSDCHCTAVDILFVIDNSGSMQQHANGVKAAFDTFVAEMITVLPADTSLHVGVTRATGFYDPGNSGGWSSPTCEASVTDGSWNPPDVADNGVNGQQGRLFEHQSKRYFEIDTSTDPQPLKDWFGGALAGAIDGWAPHSNTETVIAGASYPFHPVNAAFNSGFMREQAVLVIFLLSDSPDLTPKNIPTSDFVDMVSDAKSGCGDQCIVLTGAIAATCYQNAANTNTRLTEFLNGFGKPPASYIDLGAFGTPNFSGVLGTALAEVITTACEQIPPVG